MRFKAAHTQKGPILTSWHEAVIATLKANAPQAMGSRAIADYAIEHGYVDSRGKTPWQTVNRVIRDAMRPDSEASPIVQTSRGSYKARTSPDEQHYDPSIGWGPEGSPDAEPSRDDMAAELFRVAEVAVHEKLEPFLRNADRPNPDLANSPYKIDTISEVRVKASFGMGAPAAVAHMTFVLEDQSVQNGIYITLLYYRAEQKLVLAYTLSQTHRPSLSWPAEITGKYSTISRELGYAKYGTSYVVKVFDEPLRTLFGDAPAARESLQDELADCLLTYWEHLKGVEAKSLPFTGPVDSVDDQDAAARTRLALKTFKNVIAVGVAGVGKTHMVGRLAERYGGRVSTTVFHPSTSYEDFVRGLRPSGDTFEPQNGLFIDICNRAIRDVEHDYLLVIDEINRANTAAVLGDLLLVLEGSKRFPARKLHKLGRTWEQSTLTRGEIRELNDALASEPELTGVDYVYSAHLQTPAADKRDFLVVPDNLHVLGTMNSTDRSVGKIDLALRRRFHWSSISPMSAEELIQELSESGISSLKYGIPRGLISWWHDLNVNLSEFVGPDALIGHSYFFVKAEPIEICTAVLEQLSEIAQTFMVTEEDLERVQRIERPATWDNEGLGDVTPVRYVGRGIGRRPFVAIGTEPYPGMDQVKNAFNDVGR